MKNFIIILLTILLASACKLATGDKYQSDDGTPAIEEVQNLFKENNDGEIVFYTNNTKYNKGKGYSLIGFSKKEAETFKSRTLIVNKSSGRSIAAGFGGIYCYTDDPEYGKTFLIVLISLNGDYCVGEVINNSIFNYLVDWTASNTLDSIGYSKNTEIKLSYNEIEDFFHLAINGTEVNKFRDNEAPFHTYGKQGYVVTIYPIDDFPEIPVEVTFREIE
ncbi:MAG: hypothetical protein JXR48_18240 [Candidatus Delongbacteria bacterium]|nr:hypothetical protein [Candidatus Delongbacteria bacterium]